MRLPLTSWRAVGAVLAAVAFVLLALPQGADAGARSELRAAERVVERTVERRLGRSARVTSVRCRRSRARSGRHTCSSRAVRTTRSGRQTCTARHIVRRRGRSRRASISRLRCRRVLRRDVAASAPAAATAAAPLKSRPAPTSSKKKPTAPADDPVEPAPTPTEPAPTPTEPSPAPVEPAPAADPRFFGFNDNSVRAGQVSADTSAQLAAGTGANLTRLTFDWRYAERQPGVYDFAAYDAIYAASLARGIKPLWIVMFAPRWAWDPSVACSTTDCRYPPGDAHLADWRRLIERIAARYPESAGIEVWNEPNLALFWHGGVDPARYARLLTEAHAAVEATRPELPVVGASVSNNQVTDDRNLSMSDFLAGLYAAGGGPAMDAIAVHAYPWSLDLGTGTIFDRTLLQARTLRDLYDDPAKPLWITETGLSTSGTDLRFRFSEDQQAAGLVDQYRALAAADDVEAVVFHTLLAQVESDASIESGYATVRPDLSPKPAYCALARERTGHGC